MGWNFIAKGNRVARNLYLDFVCGHGYEGQCPEADAARWYHLFHFAIPIVGMIAFPLAVEEAYKRHMGISGRHRTTDTRKPT